MCFINGLSSKLNIETKSTVSHTIGKLQYSTANLPNHNSIEQQPLFKDISFPSCQLYKTLNSLEQNIFTEKTFMCSKGVHLYEVALFCRQRTTKFTSLHITTH